MPRKEKPSKPKSSAGSDHSKKEPTSKSEDSSQSNEANQSDVTSNGAAKEASKSGSKPVGIPRVISLIVLVAVLLLIGVLFFRVMASFLVPLFLAAVLAVICTPMHDWVCRKLPRRPNLAALVTTGIISLLVLAPLSWFGWKAYVETSQVVSTLSEKENREQIIEVVTDQAQQWEAWYREKIRGEKGSDADSVAENTENNGENSTNVSSDESSQDDILQEPLAEAADQTEDATKPIGFPTNASAKAPPFDLRKSVQDSLVKVSDNIIKFGLTGVKSLFAFAFGLGVMIFALYYFLADGPAMLESLMHLSPMDDDYERELLHQFARVSRAVVLATLITAIAQGLLAGIGYYVVQFLPMGLAEVQPGVEARAAEPIHLPVFLLTVLTMLLSIVPFVGALAVWVPTVIWVSFFVPGGFWPGIILAIYCFTIVSSADNVIKPYVLSGQSNLHPLLALLSVLGGVQLLGPIGILVGPMLVAFMQALLGMLRKELDDFNNSDEVPKITI